MAQVVVEKKRGSIKNGLPLYVWSYEIQKSIILDQDRIPAISFRNEQNEILNKDAVVFPENIEDINPLGKTPNLSEDEERISFIRGRREESQKSQEINFMEPEEDDHEEEASILIQKLRELVIRFEKLLAKYLDPDLPTGRKLKKKFLEEREIFRRTGYKDFINSIDLKVDALINFEDFDREMFCKDGDPNWFKKKIKEAMDGNFYSAQDVVNSVMQIVKNEEYGIPIRRVVTMLK
jgi:hypothetical protein